MAQSTNYAVTAGEVSLTVSMSPDVSISTKDCR